MFKKELQNTVNIICEIEKQVENINKLKTKNNRKILKKNWESEFCNYKNSSKG